MAIRTDAAAVRAINGTNKTDSEIDAYIVPASCLIDAVVDGGCAGSISDACLAQAEAFVTAHIMAQAGAQSSDKQIKQETFENYSVTYDGGVGVLAEGIMSTTYGQTANMLVGGCLATLNSPKPKVSFF